MIFVANGSLRRFIFVGRRALKLDVVVSQNSRFCPLFLAPQICLVTPWKSCISSTFGTLHDFGRYHETRPFKMNDQNKIIFVILKTATYLIQGQF